MRRGAWQALGGLLLLALIGAVIWWLGSRVERSVAAEAAVASVAPPPGAVDAEPAAPQAEADVPLANSTARHDDEIEICGGTWIKPDAEGHVDDADLARAINLAEARQRLLTSLRANAGDFSRAAALWFGMMDTPAQRSALFGVVGDCDTPECLAALSTAKERVAADRDELVRLATTTSDARAYALAFNTCSLGRPPTPACGLLSADQWARLDPGNATPWMAKLAEASERHDAQAQNDALFQIASSARIDQRFFALAGIVIDRMPTDDASLPATMALAGEAIGLEAPWSLNGMHAVLGACTPATLRDANRRQTCEAIAALMVERSDTLLDRNIGATLGRRIGWNDARVDRLRGETSAYTKAVTPPAGDVNGLGCAPLRRDLVTIKLAARLGETGALRDWIARSGKSADDFIAIAREEARVAAAAAASAASASAAASAASASR